MPTPFYHLSIAKEILESADLPSKARALLQDQSAAFLLGNTAPDVQTITGQDRQATHFYDLPILPNDKPAWEQFLETHPALAHPAHLPAGQTAFLAGYLCHLQADWKWVEEIFAPIFGTGLHWQSTHYRLYLHNVLRSYLDLNILQELKPHIATELESVNPHNWLPFVEDYSLSSWRDFLVDQLCDGCKAQTVEVFAARQGISPDEYYLLLNSEEKLDRELFSHLPRQTVHDFRRLLVAENILLLANYIDGIKHG